MSFAMRDRLKPWHESPCRPAGPSGTRQTARLQEGSHLLSPPHEGAEIVQIQRPHTDDDVDLLLAELGRVCLPAGNGQSAAPFERDMKQRGVPDCAGRRHRGEQGYRSRRQ